MLWSWVFCDSPRISCIFTARKRSLRRLCFYRCLSVHRGCVWHVVGGMHGRRRGMHGRGACMTGGHAWQGGMHGREWVCVWQGVCMSGSGVCGWGCAWLGGWCAWQGAWGACMAGGVWRGGMRATADTMGYGQWAGGMHPTGMHSCLLLYLYHFSHLMKQSRKKWRVQSHLWFIQLLRLRELIVVQWVLLC